MSLFTSPDERSAVDGAAVEDQAVSARHRRESGRLVRGVYLAGIVITGLLFLAGGWQRRWIADDGLIVLRTVRNLLAGNGPVFNMHERVETNTSAAWTYIVYAFSWLTQARLEYVVLTISLTLSVAAIVLAMLGAGLLWKRSLGAGNLLLLPAGALVYIAVPPARDYASSGLESCLVILWLGLLWVMLMRWGTSAKPSATSVLVLAFVAGLGPLVRPEMAIVAGLALAMVFLAPQQNWRVRVAMVAVAGLLPVGYQIWRMGYYALPYPNTAVAKDATGSKWGQGFTYLWNLVGPYFLWLPLLLLLIGGVVVWRSAARSTQPAAGPLWKRWQARLRSPAAVVVLVLVCGLVLGLYSLRVGGDFMHGRMLLPTLFCLILPVAVLPIRVPERAAFGSNRQTFAFAAGAVVWIGVAVWAFVASNTTGTAGTTIGASGIVDERAYYALNTGHDHPIRAEDYLDYPRMRAMVRVIDETPNGGLLINTPSFTYWDVVPPPLPIPPGGAGHTVFFLNLGMTSMNVPLDVRVIDQMGLAYPLAAHTERLDDGRIGHDKNLYPDWAVVDLGMVGEHPWLPFYLDEDWIKEAQVAIQCPETQELLRSYRGDITWARFKTNLRHSLDFANYRFDRVPKYEVELCQLDPPVLERGN